MRTLAWLAIGAVGGVVVYRRLERLADDARVNGVVGTARHATTTARGAVGTARTLADRARSTTRREPVAATGQAAAAVLRHAERGE